MSPRGQCLDGAAMVAPRPETTTTGSVMVQAVPRWETRGVPPALEGHEKSEAGHLGEFSDALALSFP